MAPPMKWQPPIPSQTAYAFAPGMNKPGGVARVSAVGEDGTYNVKYVVACTKESALGEGLRALTQLQSLLSVCDTTKRGADV